MSTYPTSLGLRPIVPQVDMNHPPTPTQSQSDSPITAGRYQEDYQYDDRFHKLMQLQRYLVENSSSTLPHVNIVTVGSQSCGKTALLRRMSGIPLHSAGKLATHGPVQLYCYHTPGPLEYKIQIRNGRNDDLFDFVSNLTAKDDIAGAIKMAGDEARRSADDQGFRNLAVVNAIPVRERVEANEEADDFTENVVVITASGESLRDFAMLDLPGLIAGDSKPEVIIRKYIQKEENVILLCLSGSANDYTSSSPEVALVKQADPRGQRTIGIITKCDLIGDALDSSMVDIIKKTNRGFKDYHPHHGWWPIYSPENIRSSIAHVFPLSSSALFDRGDWKSVQNEVVRSFDFEKCRDNLIGIFQQKVLDHFATIQPLFDEKCLNNEIEFEALPSRIDNPVGELHNCLLSLIGRARFLLLEETNTQYLGERDSVESQNFQKEWLKTRTALEKKIYTQTAEFLPYERRSTPPGTRLTSCDIATVYPSQWQVYIEDVVKDIKRETQDRVFANVQRVADLYLSRQVDRWRLTSAEHLDQAWTLIEQGLDLILRKEVVCNDVLRSQIRKFLFAKVKSHKVVLAKRLDIRCREIMETTHSTGRTQLDKHKYESYRSQWESAVRQQGLLGITNPGRNGRLLAIEDTNGTADRTSYSVGLEVRCEGAAEAGFGPNWKTAHNLQSHMSERHRSASEMMANFGKEIEGQIALFLKLSDLYAYLRQCFKLDDLQNGEKVLKRCRDLYEEEPEIRRKRSALARTKRELDEIKIRMGYLADP